MILLSVSSYDGLQITPKQKPATLENRALPAAESACRQYRAVRWFLLPEGELRPVAKADCYRRKKLGSRKFYKIGSATACMADYPERIAPKSPQKPRLGSSALSEQIANKPFILTQCFQVFSFARTLRYNAVSHLMNYPLAGAVVVPGRNGSGEIWVRVPLQDLQKDGDNYVMRGAIALAIGFEYTVDSSGKAVISSEVDYSDIHNLSMEHYIKINSAKILNISGGVIEMTALIQYYDYNVGRILTAPARFFYSRR